MASLDSQNGSETRHERDRDSRNHDALHTKLTEDEARCRDEVATGAEAFARRMDARRDPCASCAANAEPDDTSAGGDSWRAPAPGQCAASAGRRPEAHTRSIRQIARRDQHGQARAGRKAHVREAGGNAMAKTTWGRKETIIWPRHMPIYTYGLAFAVVALTFYCCVHSHSRRHAIAAVLPAGLRAHIGHRRVQPTPPQHLPDALRQWPRRCAAACHEWRCGAGQNAGAGRQADPAGALAGRRGSTVTRCSFVARSAAMWMRGCAIT